MLKWLQNSLKYLANCYKSRYNTTPFLANQHPEREASQGLADAGKALEQYRH
jgi:hypothetical protein